MGLEQSAQACPASAFFKGHTKNAAYTDVLAQQFSVRCRVSLQQLLDCLDGIDSQDGVIVVATANDPTVLDSAILRRPGRFDRVVALPAPDRQLRLRYFRKFNPDLNDEALLRGVEDSDGLSFAQLKEVYILAGQRAFEGNADVTGNDPLEGIRVLRDGMALVSNHKLKVGFGESSFEESKADRST